jgi:hypothetical protein
VGCRSSLVFGSGAERKSQNSTASRTSSSQRNTANERANNLARENSLVDRARLDRSSCALSHSHKPDRRLQGSILRLIRSHGIPLRRSLNPTYHPLTPSKLCLSTSSAVMAATAAAYASLSNGRRNVLNPLHPPFFFPPTLLSPRDKIPFTEGERLAKCPR